MSLQSEVLLVVVALVLALALGMLVWSLADIGSNGFRRYRQVFTERTHFSLRELFLFVEPERLFLLNLGLMLLVGALAFALSASWTLGLVGLAVAAWLPRSVLRQLKQRRRNALEQQLPDALLMLAGAMKAGVGLTQAIAQYVADAQAPLSQEFDLLLREQRLGVALDQALENLNQRVALSSVALVVAAMRIAAETGGQLAETLERSAQTLRSKLIMEGKIRALTSQGKLQAWVVGALPVFLLVVLQKMEPDSMQLLYHSSAGWATLVVIVLLEFFGVLIIRRIVDIDV
jgi:tight adherence protein B